MEKYIAVFDAGTTSIKGMLINQKATISEEYAVEIHTFRGANGEVEQNPMDWWNGLLTITRNWWEKDRIAPEQIAMITFSGQMEDVIPISYSNRKRNAILYSDTRAKKEADILREPVPALIEKSGNNINATTPLAKLLWMKEYEQDVYNDTAKVLFSSKDFLIYRLTDVFATDPTTGATTGMMNVKTRQWEEALITTTGLDVIKLPELKDSKEIVGYVTDSAAKETGLSEDTAVLCGAGDAGASAMGAGAVNHGDSYCYVGTTGWIAVIQKDIMQDPSLSGLFHLVHLTGNEIIRIIPLLNAGNVYQWAVDTFANGDYTKFEDLVQKSSIGSNGLVFLPYLNGERNPVDDPDAKGVFWGIKEKTKESHFARAVVEGIAFSFRQLAELLNLKRDSVMTIVGGGTKSISLCQTLADCLMQPIRVPANSEYMPAIGVASSAFIQLGWASSYQDFSERFIEKSEARIYQPSLKNEKMYTKQYERFLKLYPSLRGMYVD